MCASQVRVHHPGASTGFVEKWQIKNEGNHVQQRKKHFHLFSCGRAPAKNVRTGSQ